MALAVIFLTPDSGSKSPPLFGIAVAIFAVSGYPFGRPFISNLCLLLAAVAFYYAQWLFLAERQMESATPINPVVVGLTLGETVLLLAACNTACWLLYSLCDIRRALEPDFEAK